VPRKQRSFLDRTLARVGLSRARPKVTRSVYAGATISRLNADWITATLSADSTIRGDFRLLRERARELVRDKAYATRFIEMWSENVIGPDGIQLQATVKKADGTLDKATNKAIEEAWADFSMPENASVDGLLSLTDLAALAIEMKKQDGESLIRIWAGFDNRHAYSLQILDADVLDHTYNKSPSDGQNEIRMGVERNKWGKPVAYHLWSSHPTDYFYAPVRERVRVPAIEIIHLYSVKRPGQSRGITAFAPVMSDINMLAGYQEAELVAARGAAASMGFIYEDEEAEGEDPDAPTTIPTEAEPGTFQRLPSGLKVQQYSPEHPVAAFGQFCASILRSIASGLSVAYSSLTGDLTGANYGSLRDGSLKERDAYRKEQNWIAIQLYRRIYLQWMKYASLSGALKLPTRNMALYASHKWLARGWPWIDPEKDIKAAAMEVAYGFNSRTEVCAANGRDFEENLETLAHEEDLATELGVELATDVPKTVPVTSTVEDATQPESADNNGGDASNKPKKLKPQIAA
jgi:lambda family phage portal protein